MQKKKYNYHLKLPLPHPEKRHFPQTSNINLITSPIQTSFKNRENFHRPDYHGQPSLEPVLIKLENMYNQIENGFMEHSKIVSTYIQSVEECNEINFTRVKQQLLRISYKIHELETELLKQNEKENKNRRSGVIDLQLMNKLTGLSDDVILLSKKLEAFEAKEQKKIEEDEITKITQKIVDIEKNFNNQIKFLLETFDLEDVNTRNTRTNDILKVETKLDLVVWKEEKAKLENIISEIKVETSEAKNTTAKVEKELKKRIVDLGTQCKNSCKSIQDALVSSKKNLPKLSLEQLKEIEQKVQSVEKSHENQFKEIKTKLEEIRSVENSECLLSDEDIKKQIEDQFTSERKNFEIQLKEYEKIQNRKLKLIDEIVEEQTITRAIISEIKESNSSCEVEEKEENNIKRIESEQLSFGTRLQKIEKEQENLSGELCALRKHLKKIENKLEMTQNELIKSTKTEVTQWHLKLEEMGKAFSEKIATMKKSLDKLECTRMPSSEALVSENPDQKKLPENTSPELQRLSQDLRLSNLITAIVQNNSKYVDKQITELSQTLDKKVQHGFTEVNEVIKKLSRRLNETELEVRKEVEEKFDGVVSKLEELGVGVK
eukprot:snap_masked-scaffold_31-processed-gene-1.34-mRNA-1 protein AED:1.00 eAED:1.00 QI:0/-1/0/0/-1/1/1/0/603